MLSTMQDGPLSMAQLVRYGTTAHGDSKVTTWTGVGSRRMSYAELGRRAAQLAHALRGLGVTGDDRVATFMWNNTEHLEAYLAVPAMGAVLHTLNIRLFPDQVTYVANHAEDRVILVDASLLSLFGPILPTLTTVRHVV
ncbi:MAG: AMP-binding protein, partial [Kutzneria sp.]|nr:AMP-binding protein [Kutzneria sp.]